jgi:ABC-type transport system substrate-binding protein
MGRMFARFLSVVLGASLVVAAPAAAQTSKPTLPDVPNPLVIEASDVGRFGGTFVTTSISDPRTFNPIVAQETSSTGPLAYL